MLSMKDIFFYYAKFDLLNFVIDLWMYVYEAYHFFFFLGGSYELCVFLQNSYVEALTHSGIQN